MIYPNVWGRGALFAFSGIEGTNTLKSSMCGQLLAEHIGIAFDSHCIEMYLKLKDVFDFGFEVVASDIVKGKMNRIEPFGFLFLKQNVVLGYCPEDLALPCCHADLFQKKELEDAVIFTDGKIFYCFSILKRNGQLLFSLCRENSERSAYAETREALQTDIKKMEHVKLDYFKIVPANQLAEDERRTLGKCFSVMKSQVYTAEGKFRQRWTTPDRLPHKILWLWDSVFHSFGNVYIDPQLAYESLRSVLDTQRSDGFIPHMSSPDGGSEVTQPPVLAWASYKLYEKAGHLEWLSDSYDHLKNYLKWNLKNRDENHNYLFEWKVSPETPDCC